jgi:1,2-diacylglycerol 3-beta-galactosyltransferase
MAETGDGHRAAANALVRALAMVGGSARVECRVVDAFAACGRFLLREAVARYGPVTRRCPRLYGQLFSLTNSRERFTWLSACYQPFLRQGLRDLFLRLRPDLVISVHPLLNAVTLQVIYDLGLSLPVVTVVTDLVSAHVSWFARDVVARPRPGARSAVQSRPLAGPADRSRLCGARHLLAESAATGPRSGGGPAGGVGRRRW